MGKAEDILALRAGKAYINRGYWTKEDKSRLQEMYCNGVDFSEIALILQRSERAISVQIDKLGLRERSRCSWKKKGAVCAKSVLFMIDVKRKDTVQKAYNELGQEGKSNAFLSYLLALHAEAEPVSICLNRTQSMVLC